VALGLLEPLLQVPGAPGESRVVGGARQGQRHLLAVLEGLGEVVEGAFAQGGHRRLRAIVGGEHHNRQLGRDLLGSREDLETVHLRHRDIEDGHVEPGRVVADRVEGLVRVREGGGVEALEPQQASQGGQELALVVERQQLKALGRTPGRLLRVGGVGHQ